MSVEAFINRKSRLADVLMNYHFHVLDVSIQTPVVLSLAYGFQNCSAPEITVNTKEIKEGTFPYPHKVMESANVADITLSNGAKFFDSDFYDWISGYIRGQTGMRRSLLIVQFSEINTNSAFANIGIQNVLPTGVALSPFLDILGRMPARAWLCHSCIPVHYAASQEFDAMGHGPSLQSVTFSTKFVEEFNSGV